MLVVRGARVGDVRRYRSPVTTWPPSVRPRRDDSGMSDVWVLFTVPCPTPGGASARDLYQKRVEVINS